MTTQRDLETAAEVSLKICPKCCLYDGFTHAQCCKPADGRVAAKLIAAVPEVRSGQLGYGDGNVAFDLDEDITVVFRVDVHGLALRDVYLHKTLDVAQSAALVKALKGWLEEINR